MVVKQQYQKAWYALAATRVMIGFVFLWAFFDKLFGLGFSTKSAAAWVNGASPTSGFLKMGVNPDSPFASFFNGLAGSSVVDWLFMLGLLGIGAALVFGVGLRLAAVTGTVLLVLMWAAEIPLANNPVIDEHLVYTLVIIMAALSPRKWSLADWWLALPVVKKNRWLW